MYLRIALCAPLLACSLSAQVPTPAQPAGQAPEAQQQDPKKQIEQLVEERARLEQEIRYTKERVQSAKDVLKARLGGVQQEFQAIDAGKIASIEPKARPQRQFARVAAEDELSRQPEGTMVIVDGRAISTSYYERVMDYMRASGITGDETLLAQRVLFDMIRIESVAAKFFESKGEADIGDAMLMLQQGKSIDDVIAKYGSVRGADDKGVLEVQRNSVHGPFFEHMAFGTEPGKRAQPFRNVFGYVLMEVVERKKGATDLQDKIVCKVAQIDYAEDAQEVSQAQMAVNTGQVEILTNSEETLGLLPAMFKPVERRAPESEGERLKIQLGRAAEMLKEVEAKGEGDSEKARGLREMIEKLDAQLQALKSSGSDGGAPKAPEEAKK